MMRLIPEGTGTRLLIQHAGFDACDSQRTAFNAMDRGWSGVIIRALQDTLDAMA